MEILINNKATIIRTLHLVKCFTNDRNQAVNILKKIMGFIKLHNIKKYLPKKLGLFSQLNNKISSVFSLNSKLFPPKDLSDFYDMEQ